MTINADIKTRYGTEYLVSITNPAESTATIIDETRLNNSITDVGADFKIYAGIAIDDSVDTHVATAIEGVMIRLLERAGQGGDAVTVRFDRYIQRLRDLGLITGRDRIIPSTDSQLEPSAEKTGTETVRPAFDKNNFGAYRTDAPLESEGVDNA